MMNHNPLRASAAKPLSRGVAAHSVVAAGDGIGRRDQTSAGGNTVPPVSVGNVYHGVMCCVFCQSRLDIFQVCLFFGMASSEIFF